MSGYDIYLKEFWSKHRKVDFKATNSWDAYDAVCYEKKERLGRAKTVDHYAMTGDAYLLSNGKVVELVHCTYGYQVPQVRIFESQKDWQEYVAPMPFAIWARG